MQDSSHPQYCTVQARPQARRPQKRHRTPDGVPIYPSVEVFSVSGVWLLMPTSLDNPARRRRVAADFPTADQHFSLLLPLFFPPTSRTTHAWQPARRQPCRCADKAVKLQTGDRQPSHLSLRSGFCGGRRRQCRPRGVQCQRVGDAPPSPFDKRRRIDAQHRRGGRGRRRLARHGRRRHRRGSGRRRVVVDGGHDALRCRDRADGCRRAPSAACAPASAPPAP